MALKNIIITGSIGSYPTLSYGQKEYISSTDEQSFPIEQAVGSNGGSLPNLLGQTSSLDLFVNIDQKWSGFNNTPVGLLEYTHSIQDEFINGEFSGSSYVVTDGELVDEDCKKFLEVNTTPVPYNIFVYNSLDTPLPESSFLDFNTSPNQGEIYLFDEKNIAALPFLSILRTFKGGIKYIKVNRIDALGNDNTLSLQELTNLDIKFTDKGTINYPILSRSEYPTYYLFETNVPVNYTGITYNPFACFPSICPPPQTPYTSDNNVFNYFLSASNPADQPGGVLYYTSVVGDSLGYLDLPSGSYQPQNTSNISLIVSASATVRSTSGTTTTKIVFYKRIINSGGTTVVPGFSSTFVNLSPAGTSSIFLSGSFVPVEGERYFVAIDDDSAFSADITASLVTLLITQSISPYSSSTPNLVVLEPYLTENFFYSDCNSLFGNIDGLEYDSTFMKVNYDNGYLIPSNQQDILDNTAERAPVKPYNYSLRAQTRPRYEGSRFTSDAYNTNSVDTASLIQSSYPQYINATKYGYVPIDTYNTAIFEFNGGNPTVEVSKTSRIDIATILNVDNTSSVSTIYPSDLAFGDIIEGTIQLKSTPVITQYSTNELIVPSDVFVVTNNISPIPVFMNTGYPQDWSYVSGSQQSNSPLFITTGSFYRINNYADGDDFGKIAYTLEGTINTNGCIFLVPPYYPQPFVATNVTWSNGSNLSKITGDSYGFQIGNNPNAISIFERSWYVYKDPDGDYYPKGSVTTQTISQSIATGINNGERWFVTAFDGSFKAPINVSTTNPLPNTFTGSSDAINYPLAFSSAYEISSSFTMSGNILQFYFKSPVDGYDYSIIQGPVPSVIFGGNNGQNGLLIWKSLPNTNTLLFNGTDLVNLGLGNITTANASTTIKNNLNYISTTFGSRP